MGVGWDRRRDNMNDKCFRGCESIGVCHSCWILDTLPVAVCLCTSSYHLSLRHNLAQDRGTHTPYGGGGERERVCVHVYSVVVFEFVCVLVFVYVFVCMCMYQCWG